MPINDEHVQEMPALNGHAPHESVVWHEGDTREVVTVPTLEPPAPLSDYDDLNRSYAPVNPQVTLKLPRLRWSYRTFTLVMCALMGLATFGFLGFQYAQTLAIRNAYTPTAPGPTSTWISVTPTQVTVLSVPTPRDDNKVYQVIGGWTVVTPKTANTYRNLSFTGYEQGNYLDIQYLDGKPTPIWGTYANGVWTLHFAPSGTLILHQAGGEDFTNAIAPWKEGKR